MSDETLSQEGSIAASVAPTGPALAILWCKADPKRVGEVALVSGHATLGRGGEVPNGLQFLRQRPGRNDVCPPLSEPHLSREQLALVRDGANVRVKNKGKAPLLVGGARTTEATVRPGDVLVVSKALVLLVCTRPRALPESTALLATNWPAWGQADANGLVGESPAMWELRDRVAFVARRRGHVLLRGESGTGKELVARALHRESDRGERQLVSRNAATLPAGLIDAELFGNVRDYPNPGMRDRPGLVGQAHRSTLFLDEIGEIDEALQAHLLRVLDAEGEYTRLGESEARRSDLRLVGATNRGPEALKHDLLARLRLRLEVPGLNERREDIPLLARHLLQREAAHDPVLHDRFFDGDEPRIAARLVAELAARHYQTHVRELDALLWQSITDAAGDSLGPLGLSETKATAPGAARAQALTVAEIEAALAAANGVLKDAWPALGLKNRFQLIRLLKRHGLGRYADG